MHFSSDARLLNIDLVYYLSRPQIEVFELILPTVGLRLRRLSFNRDPRRHKWQL